MCTGIYVGKKWSAGGRQIFARNEDQSDCVWPKLYLVEPSVTKPGRFITDTGKERKEISFPLPEHTFKYTRVPDAHPESDGIYGSICINEYGVAISATMTFFDVTEEYLNLDPLKEGGEGLRESSIPDLIACQVKSCKEAVKLFGSYVDQIGVEESGALIVSDKEETWYIEFYGGHSYAGMRFSDDEVAILGIQVMLGWVDLNDQSGNYIFSPNLQNILEQVPDAVRDGESRYHLAKTVAKKYRNPVLSLRIWWLQYLLNPSKTGEFIEGEYYPLCFQPDRKITLEEVLSLCGDRFDGSKYDMMSEEKAIRYPAGIDYQSSSHVIELIPELPDSCCYIQWLSMGNARYNVFVPSFSGITETERHYHYDSIVMGIEDYSWYDLGKRIWALAKSDQHRTGLRVKRYQLDEAKQMSEEIESCLPAVAERYQKSKEAGDAFVTELSLKIATIEYQRQRALYTKLVYENIRNIVDFAEIGSLEDYFLTIIQ